MSRDVPPNAAPREIVRIYNDVIWTGRRRDLITEVVANPLRRHHPGETQVFTHDDMLRRYDGYFQRFSVLEGEGRHYVCEGAYVTLVWDFRYVEASGGKKGVISGIEIFKVVDGKITDVWNPNAVAESYPAGPWPAFEP